MMCTNKMCKQVLQHVGRNGRHIMQSTQTGDRVKRLGFSDQE